MDCGNSWEIAQEGLSAHCKYNQDVLSQLKSELSPSGFAPSRFFHLLWEEGIAVCHSWLLWRLGGSETSPARGENPPKHPQKLIFLWLRNIRCGQGWFLCLSHISNEGIQHLELGKDGRKSLLQQLNLPWMLIFVLFRVFSLLPHPWKCPRAVKSLCPQNWRSFEVFSNPTHSGMVPFLGTLSFMAQPKTLKSHSNPFFRACWQPLCAAEVPAATFWPKANNFR